MFCQIQCYKTIFHTTSDTQKYFKKTGNPPQVYEYEDVNVNVNVWWVAILPYLTLSAPRAVCGGTLLSREWWKDDEDLWRRKFSSILPTQSTKDFFNRTVRG